MIFGSWTLPEPLAEHARAWVAHPAPQPVQPRRAATVMLLRERAANDAPVLEVHLLRRVATMAFASGMYVFPGGTVDPRDSATDIGWAGPAVSEWAERLGVDPPTAQAVVCAAVRETFEECGVLLAGPDQDTVLADVRSGSWQAARRALVAREIGFAEFLAERDLVLRSDLLRPWAHWITPEFEPRRYDTYFFVAELPAAQETGLASGEADHQVWLSPAEALRRHAAGEIAMLPPTEVALRDLAEHRTVADVLAAAVDRDAVTPVMPRLEFAADGTPRLVA